VNTDIIEIKFQIRNLAAMLKNANYNHKFIINKEIERKRKELRLAIKGRIFSGIDA